MEKERKKLSFSFSSIKKRKNSNLLIVQTFLILKPDPINVTVCGRREVLVRISNPNIQRWLDDSKSRSYQVTWDRMFGRCVGEFRSVIRCCGH